MKTLIQEFKTALVLMLVFAVLLCGVYPLAVWAAAQAIFPAEANGSLVTDKNGTVRGSTLLGQTFAGESYFQSRPSAAGAGYDAANSSGTNLGPTSQKLADSVTTAVIAYRQANHLSADTAVPADAVTSSASGLDPHISVANAQLQVARVAAARGLALSAVQTLIAKNTDARDLGLLGEPRVNVLKLNIALDALR